MYAKATYTTNRMLPRDDSLLQMARSVRTWKPFLLNTPSGGTPPAPHLAHCWWGRGKPTRLSSKSKSSLAATKFHKFWGGGLDRQYCIRSHFGVDFEARRHHFLDFFNSQAYKETKLQNRPELHHNGLPCWNHFWDLLFFFENDWVPFLCVFERVPDRFWKEFGSQNGVKKDSFLCWALKTEKRDSIAPVRADRVSGCPGNS